MRIDYCPPVVYFSTNRFHGTKRNSGIRRKTGSVILQVNIRIQQQIDIYYPETEVRLRARAL